MSFSPGETIGPYRILEPLGQGGMATVYKAYHAALDRYVAIKVLHPAFKEDPNFLARFHREARIVAKLDHPNIVPIYDFAEHQGTPYLVMRYIEGKTLKTLLREGPLPVPQVIAIIRPVAEGLAYAHAQGVLHRDLKPSNIIIAHDGHVYITDFGLARMAQAGESTLSQDMLIGTPQYISPEQARGVPASERSDIYSLGVVLFELLTGRVPFSADTPYAIIHDHIFTPLPLPTSINPNLSPAIERVLLKALAKEADARFASPIELLNALEQAAQTNVSAPMPTATPSPTPAPVSAPAQPKRGVNRVALAVIGVLVLLLLLGSAFIVIQRWPTFQQAESVRVARVKVNANPQDPAAHLQLAEALAQQKNFDAALAEYDQAIKLNPKVAATYLRAGGLAEKIGDPERAIKYYRAGLEAVPNDEALAFRLTDVYLAQKMFEDARALIENIVRADAGNAQALWRLGDIERAQGKLAEALRDYTRAIAIDPNLPQAHYGLGMLALNRGATDEARRQFQIVINNPDTPPGLREEVTKQLKQLGGK
jgi:tetratricopeptide (TPR) repeat protein